MSHLDWREQYREATASPPLGAKQRVWRALASSRAPVERRWLVAAFVAAAAAGVALVVGLWPKASSGPQSGEGYALVATQARLTQAQRTVRLERGRVALSVWGAPVVIEAGPRRIEVEAAVVVVEVAGEQVTATPYFGFVRVDGAPVRNEASVPPGDVQALLALEPVEATVVRAEARAAAAIEARAWEQAAKAYGEVAASGSLRAEVALLKRGELELRQLGAPARARATFDEAGARFPSGTLALERSLSALEAAAALSDWPDVERRALAFEAGFPASERVPEVRRARAAALYALHRVEEACALAGGLPTPMPFAAACRSFER